MSKTSAFMKGCSRVVLLVGLAACSSPETIELSPGERKEVAGCLLMLVDQDGCPDLLFMGQVCPAPSGGTDAERWWGEGPNPGGFSLGLGDCLQLGRQYYCVTDVDPAVLELTYEVPEGSTPHILRNR